MGKKYTKIPILIPAYEPDERMIELLNLIDLNEQFVLIVDDGSKDGYSEIFNRAEAILGDHGFVIHYDTNMGKGYALKTGFRWLLDNVDDLTGCVTADSDGQHSPECIIKVQNCLLSNPDDLIMGVRNLKGDDVPNKSKIGNSLILFLMRVFGGVKGTDVQTGLRGISKDFMKVLLDLPGNRFEYEIEMLLATKGRCKITETEIKTIYDSKENHQTHYSPIKDSMKIGKVLFGYFIKFIFSSLTSCIIDIALFTLISWLLKDSIGVWHVTIAAVIARIISGTYNYFMNFKFVFNSSENIGRSAFKYLMTAIAIMVCSAGFTTVGVMILPQVAETFIKIFVDVVLFIASYNIQKKVVFKK